MPSTGWPVAAPRSSGTGNCRWRRRRDGTSRPILESAPPPTLTHQHRRAPCPTTHDKAPKRRRTPILVGVAAVGSLIVAPQVLPASAEPVVVSARSSTLTAALAPTPPAGESWIQGVLTDQAGNKLNNVNVEAWPMDPTASVPVASNLSYAGAPADGRHQSGVFRLAVPGGTPYRITFSTIGGSEDGDKFRKQAYGGGLAIMTRVPTAGRPTRVAAVMAASGRVVDLGKTQLVRQGTVASKTTGRLGTKKVSAGQRAKLSVRVTSRFVTNVTGKVLVKVAGKSITTRLGSASHGKATIQLPKLKKPLPGHREVRRHQHSCVVEGRPGATQREVKGPA